MECYSHIPNWVVSWNTTRRWGNHLCSIRIITRGCAARDNPNTTFVITSTTCGISWYYPIWYMGISQCTVDITPMFNRHRQWKSSDIYRSPIGQNSKNRWPIQSLIQRFRKTQSFEYSPWLFSCWDGHYSKYIKLVYVFHD